MSSLAQRICESGTLNLAEYLCTPCSGGGGIIGVDVPVNINPLGIKMEVKRDEEIKMSVNPTILKMSVSQITIGVNIEPLEIKSKVKEC